MAIVEDQSEVAALERISPFDATIAFADAARLEPYSTALSNVATAISCMASSNLHVDSRSDFRAIDRDANIRFGLAAISAGTRQVVLVATYEGRASHEATGFSDAKKQAVDAIGDACRAALARWMIYSGTHDAVAQSCGNRRLKDEFMAKAVELKSWIADAPGH